MAALLSTALQKGIVVLLFCPHHANEAADQQRQRSFLILQGHGTVGTQNIILRKCVITQLVIHSLMAGSQLHVVIF